MAASPTLLYPSDPCQEANQLASVVPRMGVVTLYGYGINVRVERGHLILQDGVGQQRRSSRFARIGHNIRRVVTVGSDGSVSLSALRWLADQNISFVMVERDGTILAVTGPVRPSDVRLRRAHALAHNNEMAVAISRHFVEQKLLGQEHVARAKLEAVSVADAIARWRADLPSAASIDAVRFIEAQAAGLYWSTFRNLPVRFPKQQLARIPQHWLTFGTRQSPVSRSPRLAVNPSNAILNYLYAIVEAECRLAAAALGLDPGFGFLHLDTIARDSLACDLMEPIRPKVDAYLIDLLARQPLTKDWFFELGNGNCRLMPGILSTLSETATTWAKHIAPVAEWLTRTLWQSAKGHNARSAKTPPTRLTQSKKYAVQAVAAPVVPVPTAKLERVCATCGAKPAYKGANCRDCAREVCRTEMLDIAKRGRLLAVTPEANAKRVEKQAKQWEARWAWKPETQPEWLTEQFYSQEIYPKLQGIEVPKIAAALDVSEGYAADIRAGRHKPHPRHWHGLAVLVNEIA